MEDGFFTIFTFFILYYVKYILKQSRIFFLDFVCIEQSG